MRSIDTSRNDLRRSEPQCDGGPQGHEQHWPLLPWPDKVVSYIFSIMNGIPGLTAIWASV